jgi:HAD superfamily hydrolase (TIGR01509 family)
MPNRAASRTTAAEDRRLPGALCEAVIFDMDGVIIDSEENWERARVAVVGEFGGTYRPEMAQDLMGMSPPEWSRYLRDRVGIPLTTAEIQREVVRQLVADYERDRPFFPGAIDAVRALSKRWPIGIASSSGRELIDLVVRLAGLGDAVSVAVSAAEAGRGKPAPDVYLRAAELLRAAPGACVAVEDSSNGIRAGKNAGMRVIAIPTAAFPAAPDALASADAVLPSIVELTPAAIELLFR